jgi:hypothetical protein
LLKKLKNRKFAKKELYNDKELASDVEMPVERTDERRSQEKYAQVSQEQSSTLGVTLNDSPQELQDINVDVAKNK